MTCIIKVFVIPSLSYHILSTYPSLSPHVTIYSCVSVLIVNTAEEGPRLKRSVILLSTCYDKLIKILQLLLHVAMNIYENIILLRI